MLPLNACVVIHCIIYMYTAFLVACLCRLQVPFLPGNTMENMHANVAYPCIVNVDDHVRVYQGDCFCPDIADLSYQKITFVITAVRFANTIDHGNQIALLFPSSQSLNIREFSQERHMQTHTKLYRACYIIFIYIITCSMC